MMPSTLCDWQYGRQCFGWLLDINLAFGEGVVGLRTSVAERAAAGIAGGVVVSPFLVAHALLDDHGSSHRANEERRYGNRGIASARGDMDIDVGSEVVDQHHLTGDFAPVLRRIRLDKVRGRIGALAALRGAWVDAIVVDRITEYRPSDLPQVGHAAKFVRMAANFADGTH